MLGLNQLLNRLRVYYLRSYLEWRRPPEKKFRVGECFVLDDMIWQNENLIKIKTRVVQEGHHSFHQVVLTIKIQLVTVGWNMYIINFSVDVDVDVDVYV